MSVRRESRPDPPLLRRILPPDEDGVQQVRVREDHRGRLLRPGGRVQAADPGVLPDGGVPDLRARIAGNGEKLQGFYNFVTFIRNYVSDRRN